MKKVCTTEPLKTTNRVKICSYILYPQYEQKPVPVNNYLSQYQLLTSQFRSVLTKCRPYWIRTKRHVIKFSENGVCLNFSLALPFNTVTRQKDSVSRLNISSIWQCLPSDGDRSLTPIDVDGRREWRHLVVANVDLVPQGARFTDQNTPQTLYFVLVIFTQSEGLTGREKCLGRRGWRWRWYLILCDHGAGSGRSSLRPLWNKYRW